MTWFTNTRRTHKQTHEECTTKRRRLDNLTIQWEHYPSCSDKPASQHAHRVVRIRHRDRTITPTGAAHSVHQHTGCLRITICWWQTC